MRINLNEIKKGFKLSFETFFNNRVCSEYYSYYFLDLLRLFFKLFAKFITFLD